MVERCTAQRSVTRRRCSRLPLSSSGQQWRVAAHAEPLLRAILLERIDLGKTRVSEPCAPTHHSQFGWSARPAPGTHASEPLECGPACLGRVAVSPRVWQEHVSELGLLAFWPDMPQTLGVGVVERDHADHDSVEIDDEEARPSPRDLRNGTFELEREPFRLDRGWRPSGGSKLCHKGRLF